MFRLLSVLMLPGILFGSINSQPICDFQQVIGPGWNYSFQNVGFPSKYVAGSSCRWVVETESDQQVKLTCDTFYVPSNYACEYDRLEIQDGTEPVELFCGGKNFTYTTKSSRLAVKLVASPDSYGGWFRCTVEPIEANVVSSE